MTDTPPTTELDVEALIIARRAALRAGIPPHEIDPVLLKTVRKATGMPPIRARKWFLLQVMDAESVEYAIKL